MLLVFSGLGIGMTLVASYFLQILYPLHDWCQEAKRVHHWCAAGQLILAKSQFFQ